MMRIRTSLTYVFLTCLFIILGVKGGYYLLDLYELPQIEQIGEYQPNLITTMYSQEGEVIAEFFLERREVVLLSRVPPEVQLAFIAAEDQRFYQHRGIDIRRIAKAAWIDLITWSRAQGASTITQQLTRNLFLTQEKTLERKIKEAFLALQIERKYSKDEVLEMYLNQIYFGNGVYGVAEAASFYLNKKVEKLNIAEAAFLAAIPKNPSLYSPVRYPENTHQRKKFILRKMFQLGFISQEKWEQAKDFTIKVTPGMPKKEIGNIYQAPYFVEWIRQQINEKYGYDRLWRGGLKIYTTLNLSMQRAAEEALIDYLKEKNFQGALIATDPHTGYVKALIGGRNFEESQFNRATQAHRQTGSAFKIVTYTAAIDTGKFNPVTPFYDGPIAFRTKRQGGSSGQIGLKGKYWIPLNYEKHFWGNVFLWEMLAHSINVSSIRLLQKVGIGTTIEYARKLGIESPLSRDLTLTLGTSGVTLLEIVRAYSTIANYGIRTKPIFVQRVEDRQGTILEENFPQAKIVLSPQSAFVMIDLLKKVVDNGTGRRVRWMGFERPCCGKTGTVGWPKEQETNKTIDAWFIGFTPDLVAGVWIGKDDATPLGEHMTGSKAAIPPWVEFMKKALKEKPIKDFPSPREIVFREIDIETGLLATPKSEDTLWFAFLKGTTPEKYHNYPEKEDTYTREFKPYFHLSLR